MSNVTLHFVDYFIIVASLVVSVAVGLRFARRQSTTSRYFSAGGNVPSWAIGMSIFATLVSSVTFLAYPGDGFANDWVRLVQGLMVPIVVLAGIGFIVPLYRKVIGLSAYEYFEKRFGYFARLYSSLGFVLAHFSKMGSVFFLLALALTGMTGVDTYTVIWVLGAAIVLLTLVGGMEAVIWLDVIQGFLLIVGGLIALLVIVLNVDGGLVTVFTVAAADRKMSLGSLDWDFVNLTFWVMAINGIFYAIQKYGTDQTIVQRYLTARSDREAIRASVAGVLVTVPVWTLFMFIGTALYVFYQGGTALPEGLRSDAVFPHFIMTELPVGVVGLIIAALMAAAISSLDSDLNCLAAVGVDDYYKRLRPDSTDAERVRMGKIIVAVSGLGAMIVASLYVTAGEAGVLGTVFALYAIFSGGIAGIFLLGIFVPRANKQGLYVGIGACVVFTGVAMLTSTRFGFGGEPRLLLDLGPLNYTHHKYMLGVYSHIVLFVVGWAASYFFPAPDVADNLTYAGWKRARRYTLSEQRG
ncbi:MAG TPA: sodium:solute symporter [Woeseiaceae bacterium]|nr:sodium:solute symporter [Woeseiaceae bacterium]